MRFSKYISAIAQNLMSIAQGLVSMTVGLAKQMGKFSAPLVLLLVVLVSTWLICSQYLTIVLKFNQAFESTIQPPPSKANSEGLSVQVNGIDGGKLILGFLMPKVESNDSGQKEFIPVEKASEKLALTPKTQEEIQEKLSQLDPQKWQVLTKLPSPIFSYNLDLVSDLTSPNGAKKSSYFLVTALLADVRMAAHRRVERLGETRAPGVAERRRLGKELLGVLPQRGDGLSQLQKLLFRLAHQFHEDVPLPSALAAKAAHDFLQLLVEALGLVRERRGPAAAPRCETCNQLERFF
jgi:hypothetical protein